MKKTALALGIAALLGLAIAQAQDAPKTDVPKPDVPKPKCEPIPEHPGRLGMTVESKRKKFNNDVKNYQDCMKAYLDLRNATMKANQEAANVAIENYNALMKKLNDEQAALKD
jgi:hypothetical protein